MGVPFTPESNHISLLRSGALWFCVGAARKPEQKGQGRVHQRDPHAGQPNQPCVSHRPYGVVEARERVADVAGRIVKEQRKPIPYRGPAEQIRPG